MTEEVLSKDVKNSSPEKPKSQDFQERLDRLSKEVFDKNRESYKIINGVGISNEVLKYKDEGVFKKMGINVVHFSNKLNGFVFTGDREALFVHKGKEYRILPDHIFIFPKEVNIFTSHDGESPYIDVRYADHEFGDGFDKLLLLPTKKEREKKEKRNGMLSEIGGSLLGIAIAGSTNTAKTSDTSRLIKGLTGAYAGGKAGEIVHDKISTKKMDIGEIPYWTGSE